MAAALLSGQPQGAAGVITTRCFNLLVLLFWAKGAPCPAPDLEEFITQIHEDDKCQVQGADGWSREMEFSRILARKGL